MPVFTFMGENTSARAIQSAWNERNTNMKPVEEMNAMEVCAYLVAKTAGKEIDDAEILRLYDIHCAKLKKELAEKNHAQVSGITPAAMRLLENYDWPGNVRELRNTIEKMVVLSTGALLDVVDVPEQMQSTTAPLVDLSSSVTLGENEKAQILAVLKEVGGNRTRAAQVLGISRRTLYRKLDEYAKEGISV